MRPASGPLATGDEGRSSSPGHPPALSKDAEERAKAAAQEVEAVNHLEKAMGGLEQ